MVGQHVFAFKFNKFYFKIKNSVDMIDKMRKETMARKKIRLSELSHIFLLIECPHILLPVKTYSIIKSFKNTLLPSLKFSIDLFYIFQLKIDLFLDRTLNIFTRYKFYIQKPQIKINSNFILIL